jgi:hypothetical protein
MMCEFCRKNDHATEDCFDKELKVLIDGFLTRYKEKTLRKSYKRENMRSANISSNASTMRKNNSAMQASLIRNNQLQFPRPSSTFQSHQKYRKASVDVAYFQRRDESSQIRPKKLFAKN